MKKLIIVLMSALALSFIAPPVYAGKSKRAKTQYVKGYTKKSGKHVNGYYRARKR